MGSTPPRIFDAAAEWLSQEGFQTGRELNNLFPINHAFYGYADLVGLRNLHDFRATAAAKVHPKLTVEADYRRVLALSPGTLRRYHSRA